MGGAHEWDESKHESIPNSDPLQPSRLLLLVTMPDPQVYQLAVGPAFHGLSGRDKLYAHYMAKYWTTTLTLEHEAYRYGTGLRGAAPGSFSDKCPQKRVVYLTL